MQQEAHNHNCERFISIGMSFLHAGTKTCMNIILYARPGRAGRLWFPRFVWGPGVGVLVIFNNLQPFLCSNSNNGKKSDNNFHDFSLLPLVCVITLVLHTNYTSQQGYVFVK